MYLTRHTDYSLRVLLYLALHSEGLATIQDIANSYGISKNHLMKVVHALNKKGYVETLRGKKGGLRLRLDPGDIRIGILVRQMEPGLALVECFTPQNACVLTPVCGLKGILALGLEAFLGALDQYTLQDVLPDRFEPQLIQLLQLNDTGDIGSEGAT